MSNDTNPLDDPIDQDERVALAIELSQEYGYSVPAMLGFLHGCLHNGLGEDEIWERAKDRFGNGGGRDGV